MDAERDLDDCPICSSNHVHLEMETWRDTIEGGAEYSFSVLCKDCGTSMPGLTYVSKDGRASDSSDTDTMDQARRKTVDRWNNRCMNSDRGRRPCLSESIFKKQVEMAEMAQELMPGGSKEFRELPRDTLNELEVYLGSCMQAEFSTNTEHNLSALNLYTDLCNEVIRRLETGTETDRQNQKVELGSEEIRDASMSDPTMQKMLDHLNEDVDYLYRYAKEGKNIMADHSLQVVLALRRAVYELDDLLPNDHPVLNRLWDIYEEELKGY